MARRQLQAAPSLRQTAASPPDEGEKAEAAWQDGLERELSRLLLAGEPGAWDTLTRQFEARMIKTALELTRGRRIEAAQKLGIGRNTITRKIQELGLDSE